MSGSVHRAGCAHGLHGFIAFGPSDARGHDDAAHTLQTAHLYAVTHFQAGEIRRRDARAEGSAGGDASRLTEHRELIHWDTDGRNRPNHALLPDDPLGPALAALNILATSYQSGLAHHHDGLRH